VTLFTLAPNGEAVLPNPRAAVNSTYKKLPSHNPHRQLEPQRNATGNKRGLRTGWDGGVAGRGGGDATRPRMLGRSANGSGVLGGVTGARRSFSA
jgi:hypothetical protein